MGAARCSLAGASVATARDHAWNEPLHARLESEACDLVEPVDAHRQLGHLAGWGCGLHGAGSSLSHHYSRGSSRNRARVTVTVRGSGRLIVRAGCCRVGWAERVVDVGASAG